jgi:hypothetical protein
MFWELTFFPIASRSDASGTTLTINGKYVGNVFYVSESADLFGILNITSLMPISFIPHICNAKQTIFSTFLISLSNENIEAIPCIANLSQK